MNRRMYALVLIAVVAMACSREEVRTSKPAPPAPATSSSPSVPIGPRPTPAEIERERLDEQWRQLQSIRSATPAASSAPASSAVNVQFTTGTKETFKDVDPSALETLPVSVPIRGDVAGPSVLRAQILLDRAAFSVGEIDGRWGKNSEIAVYFFQQTHGLPATGDVDEATYRALAAASAGPLFTRYRVTAKDTAGPFTKIPDDVYEQEKLSCLCYQSASEELAERFHISPELLLRLNPAIRENEIRAGSDLLVPAVRQTPEGGAKDIAHIVISVKGNYFHAFDAAGSLRFHAPTTLGSKYDPSPNETVKLVSVTPDPNFRYQPKLFAEVPDTNPEAELKPGPNNPVGVVWMALSKPHYGIHGTPEPGTIGYASSHGCVRLTNWDAHEMAHRVNAGIDVQFVDTRSTGAQEKHND